MTGDVIVTCGVVAIAFASVEVVLLMKLDSCVGIVSS